ncbi:uncharacterized protein EV154DRAFT_499556 [Mucor mucedo]|uniref:uncharacterized protein n=1 Tax=Mucor mucedo TaxID=29922 RepID=UPI00221FB219|nr:uncharacterized protein EV154DRAFT_499556 [Mucor mucedo]KAI7894174.1 hypothetical protein EV154DRAFT_499556 [Mucor mucedo]
MNNNDFNSNTFTWALNDQAVNTTMDKKEIEPYGFSDADLFQFLLGDEAQQTALPDTKSSMDEDSSEDAREEKRPVVTSSTSRLDFRPINDFIPESQLKTMSSKERRQLRNKISARNFRNRRKEYIGTLEDELNEQKAENSQLKLELKWAKAKMETLEKENDKLRLDLMLGVLSTPQIQQTPPFTIESSSLINSSSSDESNLSSPPNLFTDFPDNWDFVLPQTQQDTYLAHATVPNWNINQVLSKETYVAPDSQLLFRQYPLLAPALMSIVLTHTMTMSTDEILATSKLSPLPITAPTKNTTHTNAPLGNMTNKEAQAVWDILEPLTLLNERNKNITTTDEEPAVQEKVGPCNIRAAYKNVVLPYCPVSWLQTRVCKYLCEYVAKYTAGCPSRWGKEPTIIQKPLVREQINKSEQYITTCS